MCTELGEMLSASCWAKAVITSIMVIDIELSGSIVLMFSFSKITATSSFRRILIMQR